MKPYCGNPFIAPGTMGSKCQHKQTSTFADEGYFLDEETMMPSTEESVKEDDSVISDNLRDKKQWSLAAPVQNKMPEVASSVVTAESRLVVNSKMVITKHRAIHTKPSELKVMKQFQFEQPAGKLVVDSQPVNHPEKQVQQIMNEVQLLLINPCQPETTIT